MIAIEGPDRMGKATQAEQLCHFLRRQGNNVWGVEMPYDDHVTYNLIYKMLGNGFAKRFPTVFQTVQFLNKAMFGLFVLPRLRHNYDFIVTDRWRLSALIYGNEGGVNRMLNRLYYAMLVPADLTIVFCDERLNSLSEDVYEADTAFQDRVRRAYRIHAAINFDDHVVVKNTGTVQQVHNRIVAALTHLGTLNKPSRSL